MMKQIFQALSKNVYLYAMVVLSTLRSIKNKNYDWLLFLSTGLGILSVILTVICAIQNEDEAES